MRRRSFLSRLAAVAGLGAAAPLLPDPPPTATPPRPTTPPRKSTLDDLFRAEAERIGAEIHYWHLNSSPWVSHIKSPLP